MRFNPIPQLTDRQVRNFWSKVRMTGTDSCWEWQGALTSKGYGGFQILYQGFLAHRVAYFLYHGNIPDLLICHRCDNKQCVNPSHLFPGTNSDNMQDFYMKNPDAVKNYLQEKL